MHFVKWWREELSFVCRREKCINYLVMGSNFEPFYLQHQHCQGSIMAVRLRSAPTFGLWAQGRPSEFASLKECKMLMSASDDDDDCTARSVGRSVGRPRPSLTLWRISGEIIVRHVASREVAGYLHALLVTIRTCATSHEGRTPVAYYV